MKKLSNIKNNRWFMGKNEKIIKTEIVDSLQIENNSIKILKFFFDNNIQDIYTIIEKENQIKKIFYELFKTNDSKKIYPSKNGIFIFNCLNFLNLNSKIDLTPLNNEQSNSSFIISNKYFFKIFRRLQKGIHPESEILTYLNKKSFYSAPKIYATLTYKSHLGEKYTIAILEEYLPKYNNAWNEFNIKMDYKLAKAIGYETAKMHEYLKKLNGIHSKTSLLNSNKKIFKRLEILLNNELKKNSDLKNVSEKILIKLPSIKKNIFNIDNYSFSNSILKPQRIHGDLHLGQILLNSNSTNFKDSIKFIDFEGEPKRSIEYRRGYLSPAIDIAGMIRSFRYAKATSNLNSLKAELAFLKGYAQYTGINIQQLKEAIFPYITLKTIYEACYELEYRPNWFYIPAQALL